jgi:hypothetical protein
VTEGTRSQNSKHDDPLKLVFQLQKQLSLLAKLIQQQAKPSEEQESGLSEPRKKNPTKRLDYAYSVNARKNVVKTPDR